MTPQTRIAVFLMQLATWLSSHPVIVRMAIIVAVILAVTVLSYSVTYAEPLGGGGGGCTGC